MRLDRQLYRLPNLQQLWVWVEHLSTYQQMGLWSIWDCIPWGIKEVILFITWKVITKYITSGQDSHKWPIIKRLCLVIPWMETTLTPIQSPKCLAVGPLMGSQHPHLGRDKLFQSQGINYCGHRSLAMARVIGRFQGRNLLKGKTYKISVFLLKFILMIKETKKLQ